MLSAEQTASYRLGRILGFLFSFSLFTAIGTIVFSFAHKTSFLVVLPWVFGVALSVSIVGYGVRRWLA